MAHAIRIPLFSATDLEEDRILIESVLIEDAVRRAGKKIILKPLFPKSYRHGTTGVLPCSRTYSLSLELSS